MSELLVNQGKLAAKMVLAMKAIDAVAKSGKNIKQGYDYVTAADVADEVREALVAHGIGFDYDVIDEERWDKPTTNGGSMSCIQVKVGCTFTDQESGESKTVRGIGWGMDSLDKAPYKAMTGALKYVLRMNFIIPDNADPENDSDPRQQPQTQRANKTFTPAAADVDYHAQMQRSKPVGSSALNPDAEDPNEFDAHMQSTPVYDFEQQPVARKQGQVISEAQAKRFFGIAMGSGKTKPQINHFLASKGYAATGDIIKSEYEELCAWAGAK